MLYDSVVSSKRTALAPAVKKMLSRQQTALQLLLCSKLMLREAHPASRSVGYHLVHYCGSTQVTWMD